MFKIKDWSSFQSYKDRNPPWIRLHKSLLDNFQFQKMSVEARALLPMLWLLAAEDENPVSGMLRIGYEEIAFRLRTDPKAVKIAIDEIIRHGFIERAETENNDLFNDKTTSYGTVTEPLRNCHSETETETETETEYKPARRSGVLKPDDVSDQVWDDFISHRRAKKAKATETALEGIRREAVKAGWSMDAALREICMRGWQGFKSEWVEKLKSETTDGKSWEWVLAPEGYASVNMVTMNGKNWIKKPKGMQ